MKQLLLVFAMLLLFGCVGTTNTNNATTNVSVNTTINQSQGVQMGVVKGDTVEVMYLGKLENGTVFDTNMEDEAEKAKLANRHNDPLRFTVGAGEMITGFDDAVVGMQLNEEKTVTLPPAKAYGEKRSDIIITAPASDLDANVSVGMQVQNSQGYTGTITKIENGTVTIDFNHFLAGKTLIFKIKVTKIEK